MSGIPSYLCLISWIFFLSRMASDINRDQHEQHTPNLNVGRMNPLLRFFYS
jgi:hypothetical protein